MKILRPFILTYAGSFQILLAGRSSDFLHAILYTLVAALCFTSALLRRTP